MAPRDHTVPQVYLRRFGVKRKQSWYTSAINVGDPDRVWEPNVANVAAPSGFYTFTDEDGTARRELESFFGQIENLATPAFAAILDDRFWALPQWPIQPEMRLRLAWYIAAQIARTTRQRKRLIAAAGPKLKLPGTIGDADIANDHARYIVSQVATLAYLLHLRPWGLGHSSACLATSDCPVMILNGHDEPNQVAALTFWDVAFPLDPHRLLFLPGLSMVEEDPRKRSDHRIQLDGIGLAFVQATFDSADEYVFAHPSHPIRRKFLRTNARLPAPGEPANGSGFAFEYDPMHPDYTIEKRWATEHPPPSWATR